MRRLVLLTLAAAVGAIGLSAWPFQAEPARLVPAPVVDVPAGSSTTEIAVLAGGCFWGVQGVYQHLKGVTSAVSGYAGGEKRTAEYRYVTNGRTGHAESVQITFNPREITYGRLLQVFFSVAHDPDAVEPAGTGRRHAVPIGCFSGQRRAGQRRRGLHQAARSRTGVRSSDRDQNRARTRLLSGRGGAPGLPDEEPAPSLHRHARSSEDRGSQAAVSGALPRGAGACWIEMTNQRALQTRRAARGGGWGPARLIRSWPTLLNGVGPHPHASGRAALRRGCLSAVPIQSSSRDGVLARTRGSRRARPACRTSRSTPR